MCSGVEDRRTMAVKWNKDFMHWLRRIPEADRRERLQKMVSGGVLNGTSARAALKKLQSVPVVLVKRLDGVMGMMNAAKFRNAQTSEPSSKPDDIILNQEIRVYDIGEQSPSEFSTPSNVVLDCGEVEHICPQTSPKEGLKEDCPLEEVCPQLDVAPDPSAEVASKSREESHVCSVQPDESSGPFSTQSESSSRASAFVATHEESDGCRAQPHVVIEPTNSNSCPGACPSDESTPASKELCVRQSDVAMEVQSSQPSPAQVTPHSLSKVAEDVGKITQTQVSDAPPSSDKSENLEREITRSLNDMAHCVHETEQLLIKLNRRIQECESLDGDERYTATIRALLESSALLKEKNNMIRKTLESGVSQSLGRQFYPRLLKEITNKSPFELYSSMRLATMVNLLQNLADPTRDPNFIYNSFVAATLQNPVVPDLPTESRQEDSGKADSGQVAQARTTVSSNSNSSVLVENTETSSNVPQSAPKLTVKKFHTAVTGKDHDPAVANLSSRARITSVDSVASGSPQTLTCPPFPHSNNSTVSSFIAQSNLNTSSVPPSTTSFASNCSQLDSASQGHFNPGTSKPQVASSPRALSQCPSGAAPHSSVPPPGNYQQQPAQRSLTTGSISTAGSIRASKPRTAAPRPAQRKTQSRPQRPAKGRTQNMVSLQSPVDQFPVITRTLQTQQPWMSSSLNQGSMINHQSTGGNVTGTHQNLSSYGSSQQYLGVMTNSLSQNSYPSNSSSSFYPNSVGLSQPAQIMSAASFHQNLPTSNGAHFSNFPAAGNSVASSQSQRVPFVSNRTNLYSQQGTVQLNYSNTTQPIQQFPSMSQPMVQQNIVTHVTNIAPNQVWFSSQSQPGVVPTVGQSQTYPSNLQSNPNVSLPPFALVSQNSTLQGSQYCAPNPTLNAQQTFQGSPGLPNYFQASRAVNTFSSSLYSLPSIPSNAQTTMQPIRSITSCQGSVPGSQSNHRDNVHRVSEKGGQADAAQQTSRRQSAVTERASSGAQIPQYTHSSSSSGMVASGDQSYRGHLRDVVADKSVAKESPDTRACSRDSGIFTLTPEPMQDQEVGPFEFGREDRNFSSVGGNDSLLPFDTIRPSVIIGSNKYSYLNQTMESAFR